MAGRGSAVVDCAVYEHGLRRPGRHGLEDAFALANDSPGSFVWVGLYEPSQADIAEVAGVFGLHPLAVEDAVDAHQRPKLERYGEVSFLVLKTARYVEHAELTASSEVVETGEIMLFAGPNFVVSVRHGHACRLDGVRRRLESTPELLAEGPAAVLYGVADQVVDDFLAVADAIEVDIDTVENHVFAPTRGNNDAQQLYQLKRELLELRRAVMPLARPVRALAAGEVPEVTDTVTEYLRDVDDHLARVSDQIDTYGQILDGILAASLAQIAVQQNNDMRTISAVVAILAVPTMIAGIYGMNFDHMPELGWLYGYPIILLVMLTACGLVYRALRRNGWL